MKIDLPVRTPGRGRHTITVAENAIDRVIGFFAPIRARERLRARVAMALGGSYFGASTARRSVSQWTTNAYDADADLLWDLPKLRERSRDLCRNSPLASGVLGTNRMNVVGTGLRLQSRIDREFLGFDDAVADAWETATEREWHLFWETKELDVARTLNGVDMTNLVYQQAMENGEAFILMPRVARPKLPYSLKLQPIEADRISNENNVPDTTTLIAGVEKDAYGAPVRYHIQDQHPGSFRYSDPKRFTWTKVQAFGSSTGLRNVIHLYDTRRPGQTRGVPYLTPVIETLKQLDRYTEAEIMAAVVAGMFTVFIHTEDGDANFEPVAPTTESSATTSDTDLKLLNGGIVGLAPNEKIETANPGRPNTAFDAFTVSILRQIGVGLGLPFEVLIKHFTASYSASRAALIQAWQFWTTRRTWLADNFLNLVYENFMWEAVASGRIGAPGFFADPLTRAAYLGCEWIGDAMPEIDPVKGVEAARKRIELVLSTRSSETASLTGGDFSRNVRQAGKERRMLTDAGLDPAPASNPSRSGNPVPAIDTDDGADIDQKET